VLKTKIEKVTVALLSIFLLGSFGLNIYQYQQIRKIKQGSSMETLVGDQSEDNEKSVVEQFSENQAGQAETQEDQAELQMKMFKDPAYREIYRSQIKASLDSEYGAFFNEINLSSEKQDKLKDLVADQVLAIIDLNIDLAGVTPSDENTSVIEQRTKDLNEEYKKKITELLGKEGYEKYLGYTERYYARSTISSFAQSLSPADKLTDAQQQMLIDAMYAENKKITSEINNDKKSLSSSGEYDEKYIARMMEYQVREHEAVIEAGNKVLSSSQAEQLKAYLKQQREMMESSMKNQSQTDADQTTGKNTGQ
jgi:hypothetical protein